MDTNRYRYELFDHKEHGAIMVHHSEGGWVPYEEYKRSVDKTERLKKHNSSIAGFIKQRNFDIAEANRKRHEAIEDSAILRKQMEELRIHNEVLYRDNVSLSETADRLREALDGVMEGQVYSCIMGEWYWHQRTVPSLESLDKARAALETKP